MTLQDLTDLGASDDFKRDRWGRPLIEPKDGGKALAVHTQQLSRQND
jgi:hypothetical protein